MAHRRLRVVERIGGRLHLRYDRAIQSTATLSVGREGGVTLGTNPLDSKVSRHALDVTPQRRGWDVVPTNRNGVMLHLWAQPPRRITKPESLAWPRVGLRVLGHAEFEHWVLLEDHDVHTVSAARLTTGFTEVADLPPRLRPAHLEVLRLLFKDVFAWPPVTTASVRPLKQVATEIERSISAVQNRLSETVSTARAMGLARDVLLTDPEYVYLLVRAGYITPDRSDVDELLATEESP